jgi:hypothetical protein
MEDRQLFHEILIFACPLDGKPAFGGHVESSARAREIAASCTTQILSTVQLATDE